jgi:hypothetical protein
MGPALNEVPGPVIALRWETEPIPDSASELRNESDLARLLASSDSLTE